MRVLGELKLLGILASATLLGLPACGGSSSTATPDATNSASSPAPAAAVVGEGEAPAAAGGGSTPTAAPAEPAKSIEDGEAALKAAQDHMDRAARTGDLDGVKEAQGEAIDAVHAQQKAALKEMENSGMGATAEGRRALDEASKAVNDANRAAKDAMRNMPSMPSMPAMPSGF